MKLTSLPQLGRNALRAEQIVAALARYGLAGFLREVDSELVTRIVAGAGGGKAGELAKLPRPVRLRLALAELGPTFIKLGQMLSTRGDLVGPETAEELRQLQSRTDPDPPEKVAETIEAQLGGPPDEIFATFERDPLASASIAQVHRATLPNGTRVVVKVQHAGIEETITNDLDILGHLAHLAEKHSRDLRLYRPVDTVEVFRRTLLRELDFEVEARSILRFTENFAGDPTVHIPRAYPDFSSQRVLTLEALDGIPVQETQAILDADLDPVELARNGVQAFIEMIFRDRFYHADPHPGNLVAMPGNIVGLLDFGMVGHLDAATRENFEGLIEGFVARDPGLLTEYCLQLGTAPPTLDREKFEAEIDAFVNEHLATPLKDLSIGRVFADLTELIRGHRIVQKPGIQMLLKTLVVLEGTGRLLHPEFRLTEVLEPIHRKSAERRLSPSSVLRRLQRTYHDWDKLARAFPRDIADIMKRVRQGTLDVHLEHRKLDAVINRVTVGILAAALFLGSALLWSNQIPPLIFDTSVPGFLGCTAAVYLGIRLLLAVTRSGGLAGDDEGK